MKINWFNSTNAKEIGTFFQKKYYKNFFKLIINFTLKILNKLINILRNIRHRCINSFWFNFFNNIFLFLFILVKFNSIISGKGGIFSVISMTVSFFTFDLFLKYKHKLYGNIFIDLFLFFFFNVILLYILYFLFITLFDLLGFSPCSNLYLESNYESNTNLESSSKEFSISKVILNNNVIYDFKNRILEKELIEALKTIANLALYI